MALFGFPVAIFSKTNPKQSHCPNLLYISYLFYIQLVSWISEVLQWLRFAKKLFSSRPPPPRRPRVPSGPIFPLAHSGSNKIIPIIPRIPNLPNLAPSPRLGWGEAQPHWFSSRESRITSQVFPASGSPGVPQSGDSTPALGPQKAGPDPAGS